MSIVCVYKLCSCRAPAFHARVKHTDLIGRCFLFSRKKRRKQPRKSGASRLSKKLTLFRQKECASTARKLFAQSAKSSHWLSEQYVSGRQSRRITWISTLFRPARRNSARLFGTQKAAPEIRGCLLFCQSVQCLGKL